MFLNDCDLEFWISTHLTLLEAIVRVAAIANFS